MASEAHPTGSTPFPAAAGTLRLLHLKTLGSLLMGTSLKHCVATAFAALGVR